MTTDSSSTNTAAAAAFAPEPEPVVAAGGDATATAQTATSNPQKKKKLTGRAFYESIGSPKAIVAPMVDQSEFIWRMLSRSFLPESQRSSLLAYTPMFHARLFADAQKYRETHFQPTRPDDGSSSSLWLDGNPAIDRPLFVQFCANDPAHLLAAARLVEPYCDAVDLNLGCPQGIAKKGHYGSFLQEDQELIHRLIKTLAEGLSVPVTAKIRILETREKTLAYARNVLSAGASILTVHGRRREQKGHITGVADWGVIRYLRENLPKETVLFANGNILQHGDVQRCLEATGADGVMSAEGNLSNPGIFAPEPEEEETVEFWRGRDGKGGWRVDAVFRRYLDLIYKYVKDQEPPARRPLFVPGMSTEWMEVPLQTAGQENKGEHGPRKKKVKVNNSSNDRNNAQSPNYVSMQPHLFHLLRHFVTVHHDVRDALARSRLGDIGLYENILEMVERKVAQGLIDYENTGGASIAQYLEVTPIKPLAAKEREEGDKNAEEEEVESDDPESSVRTVRECKRPWWVVQPIVRPLPKEAMAKGAIKAKTAGKKKDARQRKDRRRDSDARAAGGGGGGGGVSTPAAEENKENAVAKGNGQDTESTEATDAQQIPRGAESPRKRKASEVEVEQVKL